MADSLPRRFHRFDHIDADPRAAAGTPQRLGWDYVCAWMDLLDFLRRARVVSFG